MEKTVSLTEHTHTTGGNEGKDACMTQTFMRTCGHGEQQDTQWGGGPCRHVCAGLSRLVVMAGNQSC